MNPKQTRFVAEYLKDLNATQAAIRAGYSAKTAKQMGSENLSKPVIKAAIAVGTTQQLAAAELSAAQVAEAIRRQVGPDIRALFDEHGNARPIHSLTKDQAALIASYEVVIKNAEAGDGHTDKVLRIKLKDEYRFVDLAARHLGMLTEKVEVTVVSEKAKLLAEGRARNAARKK